MSTAMTRVPPMRALAQTLEQQREAITKVAEPGTDMERLFGLVRFQMGQDAGLLSVLDSREGVISVVRATTKLAQLGLEPTGKHGGAYLVKYGRTVQVLPDWRSYRDAAIEAGAATDIYAVAIHANDSYDYGVREGREHFRHTVDPFGARGERRGWMFVAILPDGKPAYLPVTMEQIAKRKEQGNRGTWNKWPDEMERKTVIRMGCDQRLSVRSSKKLADLIAADDAAEVGDAAADPVLDVELAPEPQTGTSALRAKLSNGNGATQDVAPVQDEPARTVTLPADPAPGLTIAPEGDPSLDADAVDVTTGPTEPENKGPVDVVCPSCESSDFSRTPKRVSSQGDVLCVAPGHGKAGMRFFKLTTVTKEAWEAELNLLPTELMDAAQSAAKAALVPERGESCWSEDHGQRALKAVAEVVAQDKAKAADAGQGDLPGWE